MGLPVVALPDRQALPVVVALSRFGILAWCAWMLGTRLALPDREGRANGSSPARGSGLAIYKNNNDNRAEMLCIDLMKGDIL